MMSTEFPSASGRQRALMALVVALLLLGVGLRLAPQLMGADRFLQHYPTEDGYLMLTIARNLALGLGMSTAEGTLPTNGTQPFTTFVWSVGFRLVDGDKVLGVAIALWLQFFAAIGSTFLLWRLGRIVFAGRPGGTWIAAVAAATWGCSQRTNQHVMNCLETGFYAAALLGFANLLFVGGAPLRPWSLRRSLGLGAFLGLVFWIRIDAVFLIGSMCLVRWLCDQEFRLAPSRRSFVAACVLGGTSVLVASPWLIHNKIRFGNFTPVSGTAQSFQAGVGDNLAVMVKAVFEYATVVMPFPNSVLQKSWFFAVAAGVTLLAALMVLQTVRRGHAPARCVALVFGVFGACLAVYYGVVFGAAHFVSRYTFPISPFLALGTTALLVRLADRLQDRSRVLVLGAGAVLAVAILVATNARAFAVGARHQHWQVIEFVRTLPESTWVSAVQTGTLGYFHDRTLNLDGKVNPEALAARLRGESAWHRYIADSPADYLIDWVGMARFPIDHPDEYRGRFAVKVEDFERNLAVLERLGRN